MKRFIFLMLLMIGLDSCDSNKTDKTESTEPVVLFNADSGNLNTDSHYFWEAELNQQQGLVMRKVKQVSTDSLTVNNFIQMLTDTYPDIGLEFIRISKDSIFVQIKKSAYLTQQMGTSGADAYLATVTYNLTELNGIHLVDIRFKEGEHASPGVYSRTDFVREIKK